VELEVDSLARVDLVAHVLQQILVLEDGVQDIKRDLTVLVVLGLMVRLL
jgi:hypothetical protein